MRRPHSPTSACLPADEALGQHYAHLVLDIGSSAEVSPSLWWTCMPSRGGAVNRCVLPSWRQMRQWQLSGVGQAWLAAALPCVAQCLLAAVCDGSRLLATEQREFPHLPVRLSRRWGLCRGK